MFLCALANAGERRTICALAGYLARSGALAMTCVVTWLGLNAIPAMGCSFTARAVAFRKKGAGLLGLGPDHTRFEGTGLVSARVVAGRYQVDLLLGHGGMGAVWRAEDPLAGRMVAVKELRAPDGLGAAERDVMEKHALQEARSAARIQHPNAVTLFDVIPASADDNAIYLIMEYVDGVTLAHAIERDGRVSEQQATALCLQLLSVLAEAHQLGIVHRDIKPSNIMITRSGQAKLADFGIAHTVGAARPTSNGVMGTPAYMAPELFDSGTITPAADLWSLGATLYHAVEGHNPFERQATGAIMRAILLDPLPATPSSGPLGTAITRMLNRDPADRITIMHARSLLEDPSRTPGGRPAQTARPGETPPARQHVVTQQPEVASSKPGTLALSAMAGPDGEPANPYLRIAHEAQAAQAERSRAEAAQQEHARLEAARAEHADREQAARYEVAVQQAALAVRAEARQAAEALRQSGVSPMTIESGGTQVLGWIMWRKWRGSYTEFNSVRIYEESRPGHAQAYPEHAYGFVLGADGSLLAYQDIPPSMKGVKTAADRIVSFRDATDKELAEGIPRGATELTRGFFGVPEAELDDQDPGTAASRWQRLFGELITEELKRAARPEAGRAKPKDEIEQLKDLIIAAPNAQWVARRRGPVSFTRPMFGKPKPVYEDLEPAIPLGPLKWEFGMRDASPSAMSVDSGLTAKGVIVCMSMPAYADSSSLREPVLGPLRRVARSLGLIP